MRIFTYTLLAMVFSLSGCKSQKKLVKDAPFSIGEAICYTWVGGRPEAGSGLKLEIPLVSNDVTSIALQQAYFRGMVTDLKIVSKDGKNSANANFIRNNADKPDIISHGDATKEVGNQPPKLKDKFPFEITKDECIISYLDGDTVKYYKIEGVKEKEPLIYK